jgi:hypothetical protein
MVTRSRPRDGSENLSIRFAFVSICAAGYAYLVRLNSSKTVKSITLPNDPDVLVLAATLLGD